MWILAYNHAKWESLEIVVFCVLEAVRDPVWYKVNDACYFKLLE